MMPLLSVLALVAQTQTAVAVLEDCQPNTGRFTVQAVIRLPEMSPREWAGLLIIREALRDGTKGYTGFDLLNHATSAGEPMKIDVAFDHVRIGFSMPAGSLRVASDILEELLDKAYLQEDKLTKAAESLPFQRYSAWESWLTTWQPDFSALRRNEILTVYRRVFRPEATTVAVVGDFVKGEAESEFKRQFEDWKPEDPGRRRILAGKPEPLGPARGVELTALSADVAAGPAELLLTAYALGIGKGSAAFRIIREQMGLSYRQEAYLVPAAKGWRVALVFQHTKAADLAAVKTALKKDIESWTEETRSRAIGMMSATFDLGLGAPPICLNPKGPLRATLEDRAYLRAYSQMHTGSALDLDALRRAADGVTLDSLRETALAWVDKI